MPGRAARSMKLGKDKTHEVPIDVGGGPRLSRTPSPAHRRSQPPCVFLTEILWLISNPSQEMTHRVAFFSSAAATPQILRYRTTGVNYYTFAGLGRARGRCRRYRTEARKGYHRMYSVQPGLTRTTCFSDLA